MPGHREDCSGSLTCELAVWEKRGRVPGPAGDVVPRKAVTCHEASLPLCPPQGANLQRDTTGAFSHTQSHQNIGAGELRTCEPVPAALTHVPDSASQIRSCPSFQPPPEATMFLCHGHHPTAWTHKHTDCKHTHTPWSADFSLHCSQQRLVNQPRLCD